MKLKLAFALSLILIPMATRANPHPIRWAKHHKLLIATSAIFLAADFADSKTSIDVQRRCPTCIELNDDVFGLHPSPARMWGESAAFDAAYVWVDWFGTKDTGLTGTKDFAPEEKAKHPILYKACWLEKPITVGVMLYAASAHARAAYLNAQIPTTKRP